MTARTSNSLTSVRPLHGQRYRPRPAVPISLPSDGLCLIVEHDRRVASRRQSLAGVTADVTRTAGNQDLQLAWEITWQMTGNLPGTGLANSRHVKIPADRRELPRRNCTSAPKSAGKSSQRPAHNFEKRRIFNRSWLFLPAAHSYRNTL